MITGTITRMRTITTFKIILIYYIPRAKRISPSDNPITKLNILIESFSEYDNNGSIPCPSCTIELVSKTENGIKPPAKRVTNKRCGPDSGIKPTNAAANKNTII